MKYAFKVNAFIPPLSFVKQIFRCNNLDDYVDTHFIRLVTVLKCLIIVTKFAKILKTPLCVL